MGELEQYSILLGEIYDLTGNPAQWPSLLERLTAFVGGRVGQLAVFNLKARQRPTWAVSGHDRSSYRAFFYRHAKEDPRLDYILANPNRSVRGEDGVDLDHFHASQLYREVVRPLDIDHSLVSFFAREGDVLATVCAMRGLAQGPFNPDEVGRLNLILPHLRRAFELYALLDQGRSEVEDIASALDLVDAGVFLADADLRICHLNRVAEELVTGGKAITLREGRLTFSDPRIGRRLALAAGLALEAARGIRHLPDAEHLELSRGDEEPPLKVSLHPLPRRLEHSGHGVRAAIAVVVRKPGQSKGDTARRLQAVFTLTPAEAALAASLAGGRSLADHAGERGIAVSTARSQLKALFAKTNTNRQGELVAMLRHNIDIGLN
jgi:DNA-binding CsgD family transcriptional regulator